MSHKGTPPSKKRKFEELSSHPHEIVFTKSGSSIKGRVVGSRKNGDEVVFATTFEDGEEEETNSKTLCDDVDSRHKVVVTSISELLGQVVKKDFGEDLGGVFEGRIRGHRMDEDDGFIFQVLYSDGDEEEFNVKELLQLIISKEVRMHLKRLTQSIPSASSSPSPPLRRPEKFDPKNMIGLTFQKNFGNFGVFTGKIISHRVDDAEGLLFKVKYPDEDEEELNPSELFLLFPFKSKERIELESVLLPPIDRQTLPDGWSISTRKRKKDGRVDSYFQSPSGDVLRSITDVNRYLGRKTKKGSVHQRPRIRRLENMEKNSKKKKDENTTTERVFKDDDYDVVKRTHIQDLETKKWVPCTVYSRKGTTFQNDNRNFVEPDHSKRM